MFCLIGFCLDKLGDGVGSKEQDKCPTSTASALSSDRDQLVQRPGANPPFPYSECAKPNLLSVVISPTSYVDAINAIAGDRHARPTQKLFNVGIK